MAKKYEDFTYTNKQEAVRREIEKCDSKSTGLQVIKVSESSKEVKKLLDEYTCELAKTEAWKEVTDSYQYKRAVETSFRCIRSKISMDPLKTSEEYMVWNFLYRYAMVVRDRLYNMKLLCPELVITQLDKIGGGFYDPDIRTLTSIINETDRERRSMESYV